MTAVAISVERPAHFVTGHSICASVAAASVDGRPARTQRLILPRVGGPGQTVEMTELARADSIVIARSPEDLYDMVSDMSRMGDWSPICKACWWDEGFGPAVGSWFTGRNELPERIWETRSQVVVADRGHEFAFVVGGKFARWGYTFTPVEGGTELTESWAFLPDGIAMFNERFGPDAQVEIDNRSEAAASGIPATLAAIKIAAET